MKLLECRLSKISTDILRDEKRSDDSFKDDSEETRRELGIAKLLLRAYMTLSTISYVSYELHILHSLSDEQRIKSVSEHQRQTADARCPRSALDQTSCDEHSSPVIRTSAILDRLSIKKSVFQNRNPPTRSLEDLAETEISLALERMVKEKRSAEKTKKYMRDLSPEQLEDIELIQKRQWENWKDENPPIGKSVKGNYS